MKKSGAQGHRGQGPVKNFDRIPKVYNIAFGDAPLSARYCGRGSPWGNPFVIGGWWPLKQRRMTRDDVCDRFRDERLPKLDVNELRGADLECHCVPLRCHCNDIIRKANPGYEEAIEESKNRRKTRIEAPASKEENTKERERWKANNDKRGEERRSYREAKSDQKT